MELKLENIKPFVRQGIIRADIGARYNNIFLKTRDSRLFYVMSGKGSIEIDGTIYNLTAGSLVLFQNGTEYRWVVGDMHISIINFDFTFDAMRIPNLPNRFAPIYAENYNNANLLPIYNFPDVPLLNKPIVLSEAFNIGERVSELIVETYIKDNLRNELCSNLLKSIIINVVRKSTEKTVTIGKSGIILTKRIIEYIQSHFTEDISNKDIASEMHFDVSYMNRVFKKHTKKTIHSFLLEQRLDFAMEKLKTEKLSVSEIASASGFKDIPHFTKIFKKYVGKTPTEYRDFAENA